MKSITFIVIIYTMQCNNSIGIVDYFESFWWLSVCRENK